MPELTVLVGVKSDDPEMVKNNIYCRKLSMKYPIANPIAAPLAPPKPKPNIKPAIVAGAL